MTSFISCFDKTGELKHFPVPEEVSIYIRQLEAYILFPNESKLKKKYGFRFGNHYRRSRN